MVRFTSTEEFWERMCNPRFARISLKQGKLGDDVLLVDIAPEEIEGFIESKLDSVVKCLRLKPPKPYKKWPWRKASIDGVNE